MRVSFSVLAAVLLHGVIVGIVGVVVVRGRQAEVAPATVEVDVIAAKPDPIVDAPAAAEASSRAPSRALLRPRPVRHTPRLTIPTETPTVTTLAVAVVAPTAVAVVAPAAASPAVAPRSRGVGALFVHTDAADAALIAEPRYRTNPTPEYPIASRRRREEGVVLLNVAVDADGIPSTITINHSSGYPLLDEAALDAVRRWSFEPARAAGVPVFSTVVVPVRFSLDVR
jgi:protein TonB